MKKQLLFLLGMLTITVIMAQTSNTVINKDGTTETTYQNVKPGYNGPCKCSNPMSSDDFNQVLTQIKTRKTDKEKLRIAKHEIHDKCILPSQVKEIMVVFMSTSYRNEFLTFALKYTYDERNYYALRSKFPRGLDIYRNPNAITIYNPVNTHNELHDNWEGTNRANVVYVNWLQSSYGSGPYDQINR